MKFISHIYTLFLHRFCSLFVFLLKSCKINGKETLFTGAFAFILRSTAISMTWCQSNITLANWLLHSCVTSLMHNAAWTSVIHRSMNLVGPKQVHLRKLLKSVNILFYTETPNDHCSTSFSWEFYMCYYLNDFWKVRLTLFSAGGSSKGFPDWSAIWTSIPCMSSSESQFINQGSTTKFLWQETSNLYFYMDFIAGNKL